ncbi:hypothetical protein TrLO_g9149 [Triparma laevis f. longispina]|uniref:Uncharacterized protein n=2 Tax=Triparma laevis f. longispina TaxID=1714387 RepID=A0A9W7A3G3_9STRA|nr:hypothetical protein TrLO_g9149 [Triparma laevis f. longispina]
MDSTLAVLLGLLVMWLFLPIPYNPVLGFLFYLLICLARLCTAVRFYVICVVGALLGVIISPSIFLFIVSAILHPLSPRPSTSLVRPCIYSGYVNHTRLLPVRHAFRYPIFFLFLDVTDSNESRLFPLTSFLRVARFNTSDHLKNGEGGTGTIGARVLKYLNERTENGTRLDPSNSRVYALTSLTYFGYCFNPVTFYYVLALNSNLIAIVAEVANTPWLEQRSYVLHCQSLDDVKVSYSNHLPFEDLQVSTSTGVVNPMDYYVNYVFNKDFHVSPFMPMDFTYDWTFMVPNDKINVITKMLRSSDLHFTASFNLERRELNDSSLLWEIGKLPFFCVLVQVWIHWEAAKLWFKGVTFIPHPEEAETRASKAIALLAGIVLKPFTKKKEN